MLYDFDANRFHVSKKSSVLRFSMFTSARRRPCMCDLAPIHDDLVSVWQETVTVSSPPRPNWRFFFYSRQQGLNWVPTFDKTTRTEFAYVDGVLPRSVCLIFPQFSGNRTC
jgi:hypothetical protein